MLCLTILKNGIIIPFIETRNKYRCWQDGRVGPAQFSEGKSITAGDESIQAEDIKMKKTGGKHANAIRGRGQLPEVFLLLLDVLITIVHTGRLNGGDSVLQITNFSGSVMSPGRIRH